MKHLLLVGLHVLAHLRFRQRRARLVDAARVTHQRREVTHHENDLMAEVLKGLQLADADGVADVEVRPSRVETLLHDEPHPSFPRPLELLGERVRGNDVDRTLGDQLQLLIYGWKRGHLTSTLRFARKLDYGAK